MYPKKRIISIIILDLRLKTNLYINDSIYRILRMHRYIRANRLFDIQHKIHAIDLNDSNIQKTVTSSPILHISHHILNKLVLWPNSQQKVIAEIHKCINTMYKMTNASVHRMLHFLKPHFFIFFLYLYKYPYSFLKPSLWKNKSDITFF